MMMQWGSYGLGYGGAIMGLFGVLSLIFYGFVLYSFWKMAGALEDIARSLKELVKIQDGHEKSI